jgi:hypothetical protein
MMNYTNYMHRHSIGSVNSPSLVLAAQPLFARTAAALSRSPLGLMALCLIFVDRVAAQLFSPAAQQLGDGARAALVAFVIGFPFAVLAAFYALVSRHPTKLYAPGDFQDERHFVALARPTDPLAGVRDAPVEGDDFHLITIGPAANHAPRPLPGFYASPTATYYVTRKHRAYRLRNDTAGDALRLVERLPADCIPVASQHCDRDIRALAEAADMIGA